MQKQDEKSKGYLKQSKKIYQNRQTLGQFSKKSLEITLPSGSDSKSKKKQHFAIAKTN